VGTDKVSSTLVGDSFGDDVTQLRVLIRRPGDEQSPSSWCRMHEVQRGKYERGKLVRPQNEPPFERCTGRAVETAVPYAGVAR
jgi:hypothetical protein